MEVQEAIDVVKTLQKRFHERHWKALDRLGEALQVAAQSEGVIKAKQQEVAKLDAELKKRAATLDELQEEIIGVEVAINAKYEAADQEVRRILEDGEKQLTERVALLRVQEKEAAQALEVATRTLEVFRQRAGAEKEKVEAELLQLRSLRDELKAQLKAAVG